MPFDATRLGRNIERHRRRNGLTQIDVANNLTVTQSTVHNWEQGVNTPPLHRLYRLAEYLHTTVVELLTDDANGDANGDSEAA
jgi:transcriptional regulator with XRE-family HTH domain